MANQDKNCQIAGRRRRLIISDPFLTNEPPILSDLHTKSKTAISSNLPITGNLVVSSSTLIESNPVQASKPLNQTHSLMPNNSIIASNQAIASNSVITSHPERAKSNPLLIQPSWSRGKNQRYSLKARISNHDFQKFVKSVLCR